MATDTATFTISAPTGAYMRNFVNPTARQESAYLIGYRNGVATEWNGNGDFWFADLNIWIPANRIVTGLTVSFQYCTAQWQTGQNLRIWTAWGYTINGTNLLNMNISSTGGGGNWWGWSNSYTVNNFNSGASGNNMFLRIENYVDDGYPHYFFACCIDTISITYTYTTLGSTWLKVDGTWRRVQPWLKVNGTWKRVTIWIKIGDTWKRCG